ncbi:hypothetical protein PybrP1_004155 [[Pythium] brassicae (nom. inval.)]|nr:hypothetical protein PybrP1_004155 [[Pythium] brassicae (nom. inval.)]
MTNNHRSSGRSEDPRHASENASPPPPPPAPLTKKQALRLQRTQPPGASHQQEQEAPWLFQSLNFHHSQSLPALSSPSNALSTSLRSLRPASPLSAFTLDRDAPFFLDVASLKRLLPSASSTSAALSPRVRPASSNANGGVYGSSHQSNNRPQHSARRHRRPLVTRLEALGGPAPARRKGHKRRSIAVHGSGGAGRKFALRLDGVKGRTAATDSGGDRTEPAANAARPEHALQGAASAANVRRHERAARRSSYDEALAYDSDEARGGAEEPLGTLEDLDEAKRQKAVVAAQLNLTLDEYEALDAAFGGGRERDDSDSDDGDDDSDGATTTDRYVELFAQYDVDGSGAISPAELRELLRAAGEDMDDAELAAVLQQADADGNGAIDVDEFVALLRARKRLLRVANQMGAAGVVPGRRLGSPAPVSLSLSLSLSPSLPPLKVARALHSKQHLQQFNAHFTRPTPSCLRPGARVDLTQLRRELAVAEFGLQALDAKVRDGLHWVQQHCPVRSLRAQIFCHRWGVEKVQQLVLRMQSQALARALRKWCAFRVFERNKERADAFLKGKASQQVSALMTRWHRRATRRRFSTWRAALRARAAATTIQVAVRGWLARRRVHRLRTARREHACATLLQRCYRGYTGKRVARALFTAQREALASRRIQRAFRRHQRRALLRVVQQAKREHDSTVRLQCCARAHLARRARARQANDRARIRAATTLQRYARGRLARRLGAEMRRREAAATSVQRAFRVFRSRRRVALLRRERAFLAQHARAAAAATALQAQWRGLCARRRYVAARQERAEAERAKQKRRLASARAIQAAFRGYQARRAAQRARFERLKWLNYALLSRSALAIQACWRGYHGRLASHLRLQAMRALECEAHAAAQRIQCVARARLARAENRVRLQQRESQRRQQQTRADAALAIQKVARGRQARRVATALQQEHRAEARRALERLVAQTRSRAAVRIQCCARRFLAQRRYAAAREAAQRRARLADVRLAQQQAALVLQCAWRRSRARRLLRQRRREFERRISLMASEKAHDEIERLRKQQEAELLELKLQLLLQQSAAEQAATALRDEAARQRADEQQRRAEEADALARLQLEALLQQQSARRVLELERAQAAEKLRESLEQEKRAQAQAETLTRTQENDALVRLRLAALLEAQPPAKQPQGASALLQREAEQLRDAARALRVDQARLTIQAACLKHLARRRLARLQQAQARQLAGLEDEAERARLRAVQEKEVALARLKALMDDDARAREQELRALEAQMLERARAEKERVARRHTAAGTLQALARGFLGRQRVRAIQRQIARDRDARAAAMAAALAEAEARVAQVLAGDDRGDDNAAADNDAGADSDSDEWVEYWDENAQASYFYNTRTQEASWTRPVSAPAAASQALDSGLAPGVDHEADNYTEYGAESGGYPVAATGAEGYADQYGYYDQYGQYHYYEEDPAAAGYAGAPAAAVAAGAAFPGMFPGLAPAAYAYQAAMASMLFGFGNPMAQQFANPMLQQYANSMLPASGQTAVAVVAADTTTDAVAEEAAAVAPPDPWEKFFDQYTGAAYYYNSLTGDKYWA